MKTTKSVLSLVLALVICLGLLPAPAASASASGDLSQNYEVFEEKKLVDMKGIGGVIFKQDVYYYGLKDKAGNVVIPAKYAGMKLFKGMIIAAGEGTNYGSWYVDDKTLPKYGVIDINENIIVPFQYETIKPLASDHFGVGSPNHVYPADKSNGYLKIVKNGLSGVMTEDFQVIIPPSYYELYYSGSDYFTVSDTHNADAKAKDILWGGPRSDPMHTRWAPTCFSTPLLERECLTSPPGISLRAASQAALTLIRRTLWNYWRSSG